MINVYFTVTKVNIYTQHNGALSQRCHPMNKDFHNPIDE